MSTPPPAPVPTSPALAPSSPREKTFTSYNATQSAVYAQHRRNYAPSVYNAVLTQHAATGGQFDTLLDVGCGPGLATFSLAPHFAHAIGADPSPGMIEVARERLLALETLSPERGSSSKIRFELATAESLSVADVADSSVDLITAANAAHWFDMPPFWARAAQLLKPGGSVALWTSGEMRAHPAMPGAERIQAAQDRSLEVHMKEYITEGNRLTMGGYRELVMPWDVDPMVPGYEDKAALYRKDWSVAEEFYGGSPEVDLDTFEKMMGTGSSVVRWRAANPELVGTEGDVVRLLRREIEGILRDEGVEPDKEKVRGAAGGVLLVVKKKM